MGTTIHCYAEQRRNDTWEYLEPHLSCLGDWWQRWYRQHPEELKAYYTEQNYSAFAMLAGVRWGKHYPQVAPLRGIPGDVSPQVARAYERWKRDAHSQTYVTLRELVAFDWDRTAPWDPGDPRSRVCSLAECAGWLHAHTIPSLLDIAQCGLDSIRLIAWFDC